MSNLETFLKDHIENVLVFPDDRPIQGTLKREWLELFCASLRTEFGASIALLTAIDHGQSPERFELILVLQVPNDRRYVFVRVPIPKSDPTFPTLTGIFPNANWPEREIYDMFGINPLGHPDPRPLVWKGGWPRNQFPLRKDFSLDRSFQIHRVLNPVLAVEGEGVFEIPVGPIHAGIIEPGHFRFQAIGDTMLSLDAQLFFCHRGLEKLAEGKTPMQALLLSERQCGTCSVSNALSFCLAVEQAAGVEVPPRASFLRVIFSELERLYNHVNDVANIAAGIGFSFATQQGLRVKEELQRINSVLCGHRFLRNILVPGGVRQNPENDQIKHVIDQCKDLQKDVSEIFSIALDNSIFMDRLETTGVLSMENAIGLRAVGVAARASGIPADTRFDHPYDGYRNISGIKIITRSEGDVMARFSLRLDEINQSLSFMEEALKFMPKGPVSVRVPVPPKGSFGLGSTESARGENLNLVFWGENNMIDRYSVRTASYCNWPCIPTTIRGNIVPDFPLINKSFELCYADVDR